VVHGPVRTKQPTSPAGDTHTMTNEERGCCTWFVYRDAMVSLLIAVTIGIFIGAVGVIFTAEYFSTRPPGHLHVDKSGSDVELWLSSSSDELDIPQTTTFDKTLRFDVVLVYNLTATNATFQVLFIVNQTSGVPYDLGDTLTNLNDEVGYLNFVLGMPDLAAFLLEYVDSLPARKRSVKPPTLLSFLEDVQTNITQLQEDIVCVNSSLAANANYAYYESTATAVPVSPTTDLVALVSSGVFAQQVGVTLTGNIAVVGKAGTYILVYNVGITQTTAATTTTVSLVVGSSAITSSTLTWAGGATGTMYASGLAPVTLTTSDQIKLTVSGTAAGASIITASTQLSIWNIT